jgi:hypothetical protein
MSVEKVDHLFQLIAKDKSIIYDVLKAHLFETESKCVAFLVSFWQERWNYKVWGLYIQPVKIEK